MIEQKRSYEYNSVWPYRLTADINNKCVDCLLLTVSSMVTVTKFVILRLIVQVVPLVSLALLTAPVIR